MDSLTGGQGREGVWCRRLISPMTSWQILLLLLLLLLLCRDGDGGRTAEDSETPRQIVNQPGGTKRFPDFLLHWFMSCHIEIEHRIDRYYLHTSPTGIFFLFLFFYFLIKVNAPVCDPVSVCGYFFIFSCIDEANDKISYDNNYTHVLNE